MQETDRITAVVELLESAGQNLDDAYVAANREQADLFHRAAALRIESAVRTLRGMVLKQQIEHYMEIGSDLKLNCSLHEALSRLTTILTKAA